MHVLLKRYESESSAASANLTVPMAHPCVCDFCRALESRRKFLPIYGLLIENQTEIESKMFSSLWIPYFLDFTVMSVYFFNPFEECPSIRGRPFIFSIPPLDVLVSFRSVSCDIESSIFAKMRSPLAQKVDSCTALI